MASVLKAELVNMSSMEQTSDYNYEANMVYEITGAAHTSQAAFMADCFAVVPYQVGDSHPTPYTKAAWGLECSRVRVEPNGCSSAKVYIRFDTPAVPATTAITPSSVKWIWETSCTCRAEQQAWDVDRKGIRVKYWPMVGDPLAYMPAGTGAGQWGAAENQRRWNQAHTAQKYRPWETAICRARIRYDWISKFGANNIRKWNQILAGRVNNNFENDNSGNYPKRGIWLCQGFQISSPNNGIIFDVRGVFIRNDFGWDTVLEFQDPNNTNKIPSDVADRITAQPKFSYPYPADADRILQSGATDTDTGGAVRPKMHALFDFNSAPYTINLDDVM